MDWTKLLEGIEEEKAKQIANAINEAVEEEIAGLKQKNYELISKMKRLRDSGGNSDAETQSRIEELQNELNENKKMIERLKSDSEKKIAEYEKTIKTEKQKLIETKIDIALTENLTKLGVNALHAKYVKAALKNAVEYQEDKNGNVELKVQGKALDEWLTKDWATTDEGKAFIIVNSKGSGAMSSGGTTEKTLTRAEFEQLNAIEQMQRVKEGYTIKD